MPQLNLGRVRPVPRGDWSADADYNILDIVTLQGASYIATRNVPAGTALEDGAYWQALAEPVAAEEAAETTIAWPMVAYDPVITRASIDVGTLLYRHVPSIAVKSPAHLVGAYVFNDGSAHESAAGQSVGIIRSFDNGLSWTAKINELASSAYTENPIFQAPEGTLLGEAFVAYDAAADQEIFAAADRSFVNNAAFIAFRAATATPTVQKWTAYRVLFSTATGDVLLSSGSVSGAAPAGYSRQISIDGVAHDVIPCKPVWGRDGSLILPLACITSFGASHWITILKRSPEGIWSRCGTIPRGVVAAGGSWEPTFWEAADGTWCCQMRNIASGSQTYDNHVISWSDDLQSWQPFAYLDENIHQNRVLKARGENWYVGAGVTHYTNRNALSLMLSRDGQTWVHGFTFGNEPDATDFAHYSDICEVGGVIYAIYSQEADLATAPAPNEIRFARFLAPTDLPIMGSAKKFYELGSGTIPSVTGSILTIPPQMTGAMLTTGQDFVATIRLRVTAAPNANRYRLFDLGDGQYGRIAVEYRDNGGACELWCNNVLIETVLDPTAWRDIQIAVSRKHGVIAVLGQARACRRFDRLYLGDYSAGAAQAGSIEIDAAGCSLTEYPGGLPRQLLPAMLPIRGADVFAVNPSGDASAGVDVIAGGTGTLRYRVEGTTTAAMYWADATSRLFMQVGGVNVGYWTATGLVSDYRITTTSDVLVDGGATADFIADTDVGGISNFRHRVNGTTRAGRFYNDSTSTMTDQVGGVNLIQYAAALVDHLVSERFAQLTVNGAMVIGPGTTLTLASDAITVTGTYHLVDTEGAAATDDLVTINGGVDGQLLYLATLTSARDVVIKHATGNIFCGADRTLNTLADRICLQRRGTAWHMVSFQDN